VNPALKLGGFAAALVLLLGGAFVAGRMLLPGDPAAGSAAEPSAPASPAGHGHGESGDPADPESEGHGGHSSGAVVRGLALEQNGFRLAGPKAPARAGEAGTLSFMIMDADGDPVRDFEVSHQKRLHLIVVRTDGSRFRHVHPTLAEDGTWSVPWRWPAAGSYRLFADFVPSATGDPTTLGYGFDVPGEVPAAEPRKVVRTSTVDGYRVTLSGDLTAGGESELTATVTKGGRPVTTLEPYLGAYGHLVILREGDLGYLHVHPEGAEPEPGEVSGPEVTFVAQAPTPSRYLLYFDFQVGGKVRTAEFVLGSDPHTDHSEKSDPDGHTEKSDPDGHTEKSDPDGHDERSGSDENDQRSDPDEDHGHTDEQEDR